MFKKFYYLTLHYGIIFMFFLLIQKPVFFLSNWEHGGSSCSLSDIADIYFHGLPLDVATAAYFTIPSFLVIGFFILIPCFRPIPVLKLINGVCALLLSVVTIADASLYEFWEFKLDSTAFMYLHDPKNAFASVTAGYILVRVAAVLVLAWFGYRLLCYAVRPSFFQKELGGKWRISLLIWVMAGGILFGCMRGLRIWPNTPGRAYYSKIAFHNHVAVNPVFNVVYSLTRSERFDNQFRFFSEEKRNILYRDLFPTSGIPHTSLLKTSRPNILYIVLEGFGALFVENLGGMDSVGIQVDRISRTGVNFKQCYCSSFRTDRGIVSALSGYLGQPTASIMRYTHKIKTLPGLPKTLKRYGYSTQVLYASDITFFNMSDYFISAGHDKLISQDSFPISQRTCKWGVPDHVAFNWLLDDIRQKYETQSAPWYTTFLTLSSHTPFDVPYQRLVDEKLNAFAYTDSCFGAFIDRLKETPAWDNLLIVCTADHGFNHREIASADFPHIPFFLTGGAINGPCEIPILLSQTDIPATLLGQMGIPHDDFLFSRDVLADTYVYPFAFNTFNNGFNFRDSTGCIVYDNVAARALEGEDNRREELGKAILQTLYDDLSKR